MAWLYLYVKDSGILAALLTDRSPLFLYVFNEKCGIYGHGFWKLNSSASYDNGHTLKVHQYRFENLPICLCSYKNNTMKIWLS